MLRMTAVALASVLVASCGGTPDTATTARKAPTQEETTALANDAYVFGYPLVIVDMTRQVDDGDGAVVPGLSAWESGYSLICLAYATAFATSASLPLARIERRSA